VWTYEQFSGSLSKDGIRVGTGYSGFGPGKNDPATETIPDVGPIPCGLWTIEGPTFNSTEHGNYCLRLEPQKGTDTFGRSGFLMHGDSIEHPGQASKGCIVLPKNVRSTVWQSGDYQLTVVSGIEPNSVEVGP
jgi:Protein of unknown function (DUF2778)